MTDAVVSRALLDISHVRQLIAKDSHQSIECLFSHTRSLSCGLSLNTIPKPKPSGTSYVLHG
ncbi:MAG: hypothetical protein MUO76_08470 [Anaerolineaceae bacterium]|nr:hypothetical protein [Anaerolineaceae bacterium]